MSEIGERLARVQARIAAAARRAGRDPTSITLVAASKTVPPTIASRTPCPGEWPCGKHWERGGLWGLALASPHAPQTLLEARASSNR